MAARFWISGRADDAAGAVDAQHHRVGDRRLCLFDRNLLGIFAPAAMKEFSLDEAAMGEISFAFRIPRVHPRHTTPHRMGFSKFGAGEFLYPFEAWLRQGLCSGYTHPSLAQIVSVHPAAFFPTPAAGSTGRRLRWLAALCTRACPAAVLSGART